MAQKTDREWWHSFRTRLEKKNSAKRNDIRAVKTEEAVAFADDDSAGVR